MLDLVWWSHTSWYMVAMPPERPSSNTIHGAPGKGACERGARGEKEGGRVDARDFLLERRRKTRREEKGREARGRGERGGAPFQT